MPERYVQTILKYLAEQEGKGVKPPILFWYGTGDALRGHG